VIHGGRDRVVANVNAIQLIRQYLVFNGRLPASASPAGELPAPDATASVTLEGGRVVITDDYRVGGRLIARLIRIPELGHAWSGGDEAYAYNDPLPPDATTLFTEFFAATLRERRARPRETP
jgi:hypothetical protein